MFVGLTNCYEAEHNFIKRTLFFLMLSLLKLLNFRLLSLCISCDRCYQSWVKLTLWSWTCWWEPNTEWPAARSGRAQYPDNIEEDIANTHIFATAILKFAEKMATRLPCIDQNTIFPKLTKEEASQLVGFVKLSTKQDRWCIFARSGPILWWYLINAALHQDQLSAVGAGTGSIK